MKNIRKTELLVRRVLENDPQSRKSDFKLIVQVYKLINPEITNAPFANVMLAHKTLGLPAIESITRARRKLQQRHPYLKDQKTAELRAEQEELVLDYARN